MNPILVQLYSNTGKHKGEIIIYPIQVCGTRSDWRGLEEDGCPLDEGHAAAGGRYQRVFDVPDGYRVERLTSGEYRGICDQLRELKVDVSQYVLADTVHGSSKIRCNQGAVLTKSNPDYSDLIEQKKEEGNHFFDSLKELIK